MDGLREVRGIARLGGLWTGGGVLLGWEGC